MDSKFRTWFPASAKQDVKDKTQASTSARRTVWAGIAGSVGLVFLKGLSGYFGHSYALIADALESTTDIFSSLLLVLGLWYASRPADKNHPYGHGKIEPLFTFVVVAFLVASATAIAYESIHNIRTPHPMPEAWTLLVLGFIIGWKEISFRLVYRKGKEIGSSTLGAEAWHHRSDAITSLAAFVGISVSVFMGKGYETADDWAALFGSGFILYNSYLIFRPALGEVLDEHVYDDLVDDIRQTALTVAGIRNTEKCLIRKAGAVFHVELHAIVDGSISVSDGHTIGHCLQDTLKVALPQLGRVLIHIEPDHSLEPMLRD